MLKSLIFQEGESNKFWRVSVTGVVMTVVYGRIGSAGRAEEKEFGSNTEAKKEAQKLIAEKIKKGYKEGNATPFTEADFWNIIDRARKASKGDTGVLADVVQELLENRPVSDIIAFGNIFHKLHRQSYRSDWWGAGYLINGGCSDDGFEDFRSWVISRGEKAYYEAWADPERLMKYINEENIGACEAESLTYVAGTAYENKTGKDDFYDKLKTVPMPKMKFDWQEDDDSLYLKFPKLFKKCKDLGLY